MTLLGVGIVCFGIVAPGAGGKKMLEPKAGVVEIPCIVEKRGGVVVLVTLEGSVNPVVLRGTTGVTVDVAPKGEAIPKGETAATGGDTTGCTGFVCIDEIRGFCVTAVSGMMELSVDEISTDDL